MAENIERAHRVGDSVEASGAPGPRTLADRFCFEAELEDLYREEFPRLLCFFAKNTGRDMASDLAQEVFLRACASSTFFVADNPAGYLRRTAMNLLVDYYRRRRTTGQLWEYREDADARCDADQEHVLLGQDLDWVLTRAFGELPERTRHIFRLNRFEQKSYREIRDELGISLSAVDYHMMKALSRLRAALEEEC